ncbi:hypothetical protein ACW0JT_10865 [Arthrobacter sp. SA17]
MIRAIVRNEKSLQPQLDNLHKTLTEHRHALLDHVASSTMSVSGGDAPHTRPCSHWPS